MYFTKNTVSHFTVHITWRRTNETSGEGATVRAVIMAYGVVHELSLVLLVLAEVVICGSVLEWAEWRKNLKSV